MKFSYAGAAVALALAAALAACGGKAQFTVQGSVATVDANNNVLGALSNSGLVLANGGGTVNVPAGATSFAFAQQIDYGTSYNITIQKQPDHMTCEIGGGNGSAGYTVSIQASVACRQNAYTLGGRFTGLTADGTTARSVTLINGSAGGGVTITSAAATDAAAGSGDFTLGSIADGQAYGVTILTQPAGLVCTLTNGAGVMHEAPISNLQLTCVPVPK